MNACGSFRPFYLPFKGASGSDIGPGEQALSILNEARALVSSGVTGVAITYSANYGQTLAIARAYAEGFWHTRTDGSNQAAVMREMENLMEVEFADLQGKLRIAPITTMSYESPLYEGTSHEAVVRQDLARIRSLLLGGWTVLGWQNQLGGAAYAVGGGVAAERLENGRAAFPAELEALVQEVLKGFELEFARGE